MKCFFLFLLRLMLVDDMLISVGCAVWQIVVVLRSHDKEERSERRAYAMCAENIARTSDL